MLNKSWVIGTLNSGPRQTKLTDEDTSVTFFEILYYIEGDKRDSTVRKSVVHCVSYGKKANAFYNLLLPYKTKDDGGEYEGMPPTLIVDGSLQSRKIKVSPTRKLRIMELNVRSMTIVDANKPEICVGHESNDEELPATTEE